MNPPRESASMIGAYGEWAAGLAAPASSQWSLQHCPPAEFAARRAAARRRVIELMAPPPRPASVAPTVIRRHEFDGLEIETLAWPQPAGAPTEAWVFRPAGARGRLPAVLAMHDHGAFKFYGKEKIAQAGSAVHPLVAVHRAEAYSGRAWVNELARRGYVVLVHDAYAFGSRRVRFADLPPELRGPAADDDDSPAGITAYNRWAMEHEHVMAKSLFCAGTTWPGVFTAEDQVALDVLGARPDVDPDRIGCVGLSGGGLRAGFLSGLDERIRAGVCVGMMTTWRDFLLHKSHTHTWMCFVPLLPRELDFPEIMGLRAPLASLVMNTRADGLFTLAGMQDAEAVLRRVYANAGHPDRFRCSWHDGHHQFNRAMQEEAFAWLDTHLVGKK